MKARTASFRLAVVILTVASFHLCTAHASIVQWAGNGHYYEAVYVPAGISWDSANVAATARDGYLATVISLTENNFVYSLVTDTKYWFRDGANNMLGPYLGGLKNEQGNWTWVTGETWSYAPWGFQQPNNFLGIENRINYLGIAGSTDNSFNDYPQSQAQIFGYVVEWNIQPVPEPPSYLTGVLLMLPVLLQGLRYVRNRKKPA